MSNKRLIVEIAEGLGNQLFMYSYAYALSKKLGYDLLIDNTSGFSKKKNQLRKHQQYMLSYFNINQDIAPENLKYDTFYKQYKKKIELLVDKFSIKKKFIKEKNIKINGNKIALPMHTASSDKLSDVLYVQGNFEDEYYFKHLRDEIINLYKPSANYINRNNIMINNLKKTNSVSIHIRMNRYNEQPHEKNNKQKLLKSEQFTKNIVDYTYRAISYFQDKINDPIFFIWSNDLNSIKNYFNGPNFHFVCGNDVLNDFNLFSYAKLFIVGPSSFHWWGAWLNQNPNKFCVCPHNLSPSNNKNFYPLNWQRI